MIDNPNPMHPGEILDELYLNSESGFNQSTLAKAIGCKPGKINEIVNGKRGISAEFALDLAEVLGTSPEMWLNIQTQYDLFVAKEKRQKRA